MPAPSDSDGDYQILRTAEGQAPLKHALEAADDHLRDEILGAVRRINRTLVLEPGEQGESRGGGRRILIDSPLAVLFSVNESRKLVTIERSWVTRRGPEAAV